MAFVVGLFRIQRQNDSMWVVMDRLTKSTHFVPVKSTYSKKDYAMLFIDEIVCRYDILLFIISDRGSQFKLGFGGNFKNDWVQR